MNITDTLAERYDWRNSPSYNQFTDGNGFLTDEILVMLNELPTATLQDIHEKLHLTGNGGYDPHRILHDAIIIILDARHVTHTRW